MHSIEMVAQMMMNRQQGQIQIGTKESFVFLLCTVKYQISKKGTKHVTK